MKDSVKFSRSPVDCIWRGLHGNLTKATTRNASATTEVALTAHLIKRTATLDDALLARIREDLLHRYGIGHRPSSLRAQDARKSVRADVVIERRRGFWHKKASFPWKLMHLPQIRPQPIAESAFSPAALEPTNEAYAFAKIAGIEHPNAIYIVRVVGNESVRPATIVLNDDRETALRLFDLVSAITEQTIESSRDVFEASRIKARGD